MMRLFLLHLLRVLRYQNPRLHLLGFLDLVDVGAVEVIPGMATFVWPNWASCTSLGIGPAGALGHSRDNWSATMLSCPFTYASSKS